MTVKVALRLDGLDLRDIESYARIPAELAEVFFQANGGVSLAVVYSDSATPVEDAADCARLIGTLIPGAAVVRAHEELVSIPDIAARCDVATEAVRLWATGKRRTTLRPFPQPREVIGFGAGRTMSIYAWAEVVEWVRVVLGFDPDAGIDYLDDQQYAQLNAELSDISARVASKTDTGWCSLRVTEHVTARVSPPGPVPSGTVSSLSRMDELLVEETPARVGSCAVAGR